MAIPLTLRAAALTTIAALGTWAVSTGSTPTQPPADSSADPVPAAARVKNAYGELPLSFEVNQGQSDGRVEFLARGQGYSLFLTPAEAVLSLHPAARRGPPADVVVRMRLSDANPRPHVAGLELLPGTSNYFIGSDPRQWRRDVPSYARVKYSSVYPGIDLIYYGNQRHLEYDIVVAPHADPRQVALAFDGVETMSLDQDGNLVLHTSRGDLAQHAPVIYQDMNGRRQKVDGRYVLRANHGVGVEVADYDTTQALVIDPLLSYSTYLGGNGNDIGYAIAVDGAGNAYVTGVTSSTDFPGAGTSPIQSAKSASNDVFVTKLNAAGSALVYSTYLGGSGGDTGYAIAVDSAGNAYVTGETDSPTAAGIGNIPFPLVGAFQPSYRGGGDAFITKINAAGNALVYSTYLGGSSGERGYGIAVDSSGNAYVTGSTSTSQINPVVPGVNDFPTVAPFQAQNGGGFDAFVTKINAAGTALVYSSFLGGSGSEFSTDGGAIAVDSDGNAYVGGTTFSTNFPGASTSTIQSANGGGGRSDGFVVKINAAGSALLYSTYLGGINDEAVNGIAIDAVRNAYVVGYTNSLNFPTASPLQATKGDTAQSGEDAFVAKINAAGSALVYSTYLGGNGTSERAYAVAVDAGGNAYVSGATGSSNFPTVAPIQGYSGSRDAFISELNAAGSALLFSTYLGGSTGDEHGYGIALDRVGNVYVAGDTSSNNLPTVNPFQPAFGKTGGTAAFVARVFAPANRFNYFADFAGTGCSGGEFLYVPSSGQSLTALTNGDGTYAYVSTLLASGFDILRTGDFTGDGKADLIVFNSSTAVGYIGVGAGDGTFAFQSLFWSPGYDFVETGDLDVRDANTDVILYNSHTGTMYAGTSNGSGGFTYKYTLVSAGFTYVRLADFTGDGKGDLFLYRASDGLAYLGVGDGAGGFAFSPLTVSPGYNLADVGDLNGDGKADLILYNGTTGNAATAISNGAGGLAFTPMVFSPGFTSVRLANHTGDNYADLIVYNKNNSAAFFGTGTGTGTFTFQALSWGPGYDYVIPEHVNCDGKADVILYDSATGTEYTGISNGDGTFTYTFSSWGAGRVPVDQNHPGVIPVAPAVALNRKALAFSATSTGSAFTSQTAPQRISLTQTAGPAVSWTATSDKPWLVVTPGSGSGAATLIVTVAFDATVAAAGNATGSINVVVTGASNTVGPIAVTLATVAATAPPSIPFGVFDTPVGDATVLAGSIAVTGWTLDNVGVMRVELWRDLQPGETTPPFASTPSDPRTGKVFISNATFVDNARPDVETLYPTTPFAYRAGWGYLLLTWGLWNQGNGTYKLYAFAFDQESNVATIGSKSIVVSNNAATKPFGSIDTPGIGGDASGPNFGWGLTPKVNGVATCKIASNGVQVSIDSGPLQPVVYGDARSDIAGAFLDFSNSAAAGGHFIFDWTTLANGTHTIGWLIVDDCNRADGVGSRFFNVTTGTNLIAGETPTGVPAPALMAATSQAPLQESDAPITVAKGYGELPLVVDPGLAGSRTIEVHQGERVEMRLPHGFDTAYQLGPAGEARALPTGSTWDAAAGIFYWHPAAGFLGGFRIVFSDGRERISVRVVIAP